MTEQAPRKRTRPAAQEKPAEKAPPREIDAFVKQAGKLHGPEVIRLAELNPKFKHLPLGILPLDLALHGGIPEGLITLIHGRAGSGKTTIVMRAIAAAQRKYPDKVAVLVDAEGTYHAVWGAFHGVDNSRLIVIQPDTGEQALDLYRGAVNSFETCLVALDSIAALVPSTELDKSFEDATVGRQAALVSRFCRVVSGDLSNQKKRGHRPALIWINQPRMKIGGYGNPQTLSGGEAQYFYAGVRIETKNKEVMGKDEYGSPTVDHNQHTFVLHKSKVGAGMREAEFRMIRNPSSPLGQGFIDDAPTTREWARSRGLIWGSGPTQGMAPWYVDGLDTKFGKLDDIADYFYSDDEFYAGFKDRLIRMYREQCGLEPDYL